MLEASGKLVAESYQELTAVRCVLF